MGFNNDGMQAMARRSARVRSSDKFCGTLLGVNLGKIKTHPTKTRPLDYLSMDCSLIKADHFTINPPSLTRWLAPAPAR